MWTSGLHLNLFHTDTVTLFSSVSVSSKIFGAKLFASLLNRKSQ